MLHPIPTLTIDVQTGALSMSAAVDHVHKLSAVRLANTTPPAPLFQSDKASSEKIAMTSPVAMSLSKEGDNSSDGPTGPVKMVSGAPHGDSRLSMECT